MKITMPICVISFFLTVYLQRQTSSPGPYIPPFCQMPAGQLRPPPAHQPLPAHFNTATHIAMRPGNLHKFMNQVICIQCINILIKLQAIKSFEDLKYYKLFSHNAS